MIGIGNAGLAPPIPLDQHRGRGYSSSRRKAMCDHNAIEECGTEVFTYWIGDVLNVSEFQEVYCPDCGNTFLLDDLLNFG